MHLLQNANHVQGVPELHGGDICTFCTPSWTQEQPIFDNHSFTSLGSKFLTYFDSPVYVEKMTTPSTKLRHNAKASLTVFIDEGVRGKKFFISMFFLMFCIDL